LAEASFPVFSNGVCLRGTIKGFDAPAWVQQPIRIGEVVVQPGDLVVGDRDGVVVLPSAHAQAALAAGVRRESDEREKIARISAGETTLDLYELG
jgi:4-hydroxy-4-methyl-2-oxoglutarate aldolase